MAHDIRKPQPHKPMPPKPSPKPGDDAQTGR